VLAARRPMALYEDMGDLVRIGAYKAGTNPEVDDAIALNPRLEAFLTQKKDEQTGLSAGYEALAAILGGNGRA